MGTMYLTLIRKRTIAKLSMLILVISSTLLWTGKNYFTKTILVILLVIIIYNYIKLLISFNFKELKLSANNYSQSDVFKKQYYTISTFLLLIANIAIFKNYFEITLLSLFAAGLNILDMVQFRVEEIRKNHVLK